MSEPKPSAEAPAPVIEWMLPIGYTEPTPDCPPHVRDRNCAWFGCIPYPKPSAEVRGERPAPRPDGWYWTQMQTLPGAIWRPAWHDAANQEWILNGCHLRGEPKVIGPRIPSPDEPPLVSPQKLREAAGLIASLLLVLIKTHSQHFEESELAVIREQMAELEKGADWLEGRGHA